MASWSDVGANDGLHGHHGDGGGADNNHGDGGHGGDPWQNYDGGQDLPGGEAEHVEWTRVHRSGTYMCL